MIGWHALHAAAPALLHAFMRGQVQLLMQKTAAASKNLFISIKRSAPRREYLTVICGHGDV